jgi:hypothetical protein
MRGESLMSDRLKRNTNRCSCWFLALAITGLLGSCAELPDEQAAGETSASEQEVQLDGAQQAILNGFVIDPNNNGIVIIQHFLTATNKTATCSGTLLRNDLLLTARHCTSTDTEVNGPVDGDIANYFLVMGNQWRFINRVLPMPGSGNDLAILVIQGGFWMNGSGTNHKYSVSSNPTSSIEGSLLPCFGYGGDGRTLRGGYVFMDFHQQGVVFTAPGPGNVTFQHGDSGGPCFALESGLLKIAGVNSMENLITGADTFRTWANQQTCSWSTMPGACTP